MAEKKKTPAETEKQSFTTALSQWSNEMTGLVARDYETCGVVFDDYAKKCAMEAMASIFNLVRTNDKVDMEKLNKSNLRGIVERCASLKLNASAYPREVYFQIRTVKVGSEYIPTVEMGIEGDGYDALLTNYGKDVERVYPYWAVKEGDVYVPPKRRGIETTPPEWEEKGVSTKIARIVYPVKLTDGTITYLTAERESAKDNLFAHVRNNLMNETFGVCESRYKATPRQLEEISKKKEEIFEALRACATVDEMLVCEKARPYISAAWLDTPEGMITRKLRNNATKKYPKNYDPMANKAFMEMDETYQNVQAEIQQNANSVEFEADVADVVDTKPELPDFMKGGE